MSQIVINPACDNAQDILDEIQMDIEAEGYGINLTLLGNDKIMATGTKSDLANLCCSEGFMDRFFTGLTKKEIKSFIK